MLDSLYDLKALSTLSCSLSPLWFTAISTNKYLAHRVSFRFRPLRWPKLTLLVQREVWESRGNNEAFRLRHSLLRWKEGPHIVWGKESPWPKVMDPLLKPALMVTWENRLVEEDILAGEIIQTLGKCGSHSTCKNGGAGWLPSNCIATRQNDNEKLRVVKTQLQLSVRQEDLLGSTQRPWFSAGEEQAPLIANMRANTESFWDKRMLTPGRSLMLIWKALNS